MRATIGGCCRYRQRRYISRPDVADLLRVERLDLSLAPFDWRFARERRAEIDAHFETLRRSKPAIWNGRVLLMHYHEFADSTLRGACFETDFASFVAWRDFGFPDSSVKNVFALGALAGLGWRLCAGGDGLAHHECRPDLFPRRHAGPERYRRRPGRSGSGRAPRGAGGDRACTGPNSRSIPAGIASRQDR